MLKSRSVTSTVTINYLALLQRKTSIIWFGYDGNKNKTGCKSTLENNWFEIS